MKKDLPNRKPTRLKNYDYSSEGAYFITICTHNRKNILCAIPYKRNRSKGLLLYGIKHINIRIEDIIEYKK